MDEMLQAQLFRAILSAIQKLSYENKPAVNRIVEDANRLLDPILGPVPKANNPKASANAAKSSSFQRLTGEEERAFWQRKIDEEKKKQATAAANGKNPFT